MDGTLQAWLAHAKEHGRSALIGVSLGGPEKVQVYNKIDEMTGDDFEDIVAMLFILFSGHPDAPVQKRLELMDMAYRHARMSVALEGMPSMGKA